MKRKYVVRWYEWNLTQQREQWFFLEPIASLYAWYIEYTKDVIAKIYRYD